MSLNRFDLFFFFFSSRRRHTRYWRDWSSDVCSSDLRCVAQKKRSRPPSRTGPMSPGIAAAGVCGSATWTASASCSWTVKREAANGATTAMTRLYGWGRRGERLVDAVPAGHWKTTTFVAGLRRDGVIAPCVFDGPMTGEMFRASVEQMLAPSLRCQDVRSEEHTSELQSRQYLV